MTGHNEKDRNMGTTATFSFKHSNGYGVQVTVKQHWDGYVSGAADMLFNCETLEPACCVEEFVRINPRAEVTPSHDAHGFADYRYSIVYHGKGKADIMARRRIGGSENYEIIFQGSLGDFIDIHHAEMFEACPTA